MYVPPSSELPAELDDALAEYIHGRETRKHHAVDDSKHNGHVEYVAPLRPHHAVVNRPRLTAVAARRAPARFRPMDRTTSELVATWMAEVGAWHLLQCAGDLHVPDRQLDEPAG